MFIFGANNDSPDTITHSVTSPFEMPTVFSNSTTFTFPLDFNPHLNSFQESPLPGNVAMTNLFTEPEPTPEPEQPAEEISND